jgi:NADPH:quinone reductase-like Zn-dependent oxidoreductase
MVKAIGADKAIDYTKEDFTKSGEKYDVIYDTVDKVSLGEAIKSLNSKGHLLLASAGISSMLGGAITSIFSSKKIVSGVIKETVKDMNFIKQLIENGKLKATIDKTFSLEQIAKAHAYVDGGHKKGNVVITTGS